MNSAPSAAARQSHSRLFGIMGRRGSLRTQLIAWNTIALTVLFALFGGVIRYTVRSFMLTAVDRELRARTQRAMGPPPRLRPPGKGPNRPEEAGGDPPNRDGAGPENPDAPAPPPPGRQQEAGTDGPPQTPAPPPQDNTPYRPQRYTLGGQPFDNANENSNENGSAINNENSNENSHALWDKAAFERAAGGATLYSTVTLNGEPFRVLSRPFPPDRPPDGVIQAPYPLAEVNTAIAGLDRALLMLVPVALLCAGLAGAWLTDRVLRRVRLMTYAAEQIGARDLSERLPVMGNDEFASLAETFNGLLGRVEITFREQERALEQQRRFTADASHELKTPLTVIRGNASLALDGPQEPEVYRQSLAEIDRSAQTMSHLVQDLLLLARSDGGQLGQNRIELLIREILERARGGIAPEQRARIVLDVQDASLRVMGSEAELTRLFSNLLDNAVRYTPPEGRVTVTARQRGGMVEVRVQDTGVGIAPEHLAHLGERFYRVDASRSRPSGGTGLGLSICKGIVEAHEGTLAFASAPGAGTAVTVTLPAAT